MILVLISHQAIVISHGPMIHEVARDPNGLAVLILTHLEAPRHTGPLSVFPVLAATGTVADAGPVLDPLVVHAVMTRLIAMVGEAPALLLQRASGHLLRSHH